MPVMWRIIENSHWPTDHIQQQWLAGKFYVILGIKVMPHYIHVYYPVFTIKNEKSLLKQVFKIVRVNLWLFSHIDIAPLAMKCINISKSVGSLRKCA